MSEALLTVEDVAEMLQMSPQWVRQHANGFRKPSIPSIRLGKVVRFRRSEVETFIEQQKRGNAA